MESKHQRISVGAHQFKFEDVGDYLEGTYLGFRPIVWDDGRPGKIHHVGKDDGVYSFSGTYRLDEELAKVAPYADVTIEYVGQAKTKRGLSPVRLFDITASETIGDIPGLQFGAGASVGELTAPVVRPVLDSGSYEYLVVDERTGELDDDSLR